MDDKYVFANIKLPMKIINNGTKYELFNNRMIIEFEKCDCLPEPTSYENQELISKIFSVHKEEEKQPVPEEVIKIFKEDLELKTPKKRQNISFKKRTNKGQYTRRNY